jgi:hypothetical protein
MPAKKKLSAVLRLEDLENRMEDVDASVDTLQTTVSGAGGAVRGLMQNVKTLRDEASERAKKWRKVRKGHSQRMNLLSSRLDGFRNRVVKLEKASSPDYGFKGAHPLAGTLSGWKVRVAAHAHECASPTCLCICPSYSRVIPEGSHYVDTWDYEMEHVRYHRGCNPYLNPNKEVKGKTLPPVPERRSHAGQILNVTVEHDATFSKGCYFDGERGCRLQVIRSTTCLALIVALAVSAVLWLAFSSPTPPVVIPPSLLEGLTVIT